ncbi:hypothetical protein MMC12_001617 [Toensbergia leucococca]|nr:hypothetical protein [Toensbergia leucococca]
MSEPEALHITLIGAGTIGLSLAALHLQHASTSSSRPLRLTIHDTRPDLEDYVRQTLPLYLQPKPQDPSKPAEKIAPSGQEIVNQHFTSGRLNLDPNLVTAVATADIIQEQGPENRLFKTALWPQIEQHCRADCLLWSSTSGIPASVQAQHMQDPTRLLVVHPYNPPHIIPLLEIVPAPLTRPEIVEQTVRFWKGMGREAVVIKKEVPGFVANRLAFALLREAIHLVNEGVASAADIDTIVQASMGPRWAVAGPFKSYHAGGGQGGLEAFFRNIGGTVQECWDDGGTVNVGEGWEEDIFRQTEEAYGAVDTRERDLRTLEVLRAARSNVRE